MATLAGCFGLQRSVNSANLLKIQLGQSSAEVVKVCGSPGKAERFTKGEHGYEVLFYYTDYIGEFKNWEQGHTPVVIRDGKVIGVGWRSLQAAGIDMDDITVKVKSR